MLVCPRMGELLRYGGVQAACAGAEHDVAARKRAVRRADTPLAAFAVVGGFFNIVFGKQADVRVVQQPFNQRGRIEPCAHRPEQPILFHGNAGQLRGFFGADGAVQMRVLRLLCQ